MEYLMLDNIERRISDGREAFYSIKDYESDVVLVGLTPRINEEHEFEPQSFCIAGEGLTEAEALTEFWEDYRTQMGLFPVNPGPIFWRQKPKAEKHKDFLNDQIKFRISARFVLAEKI